MHKWYEWNGTLLSKCDTHVFFFSLQSLCVRLIVAVFDISHNLSFSQHQNEHCWRRHYHNKLIFQRWRSKQLLIYKTKSKECHRHPKQSFIKQRAAWKISILRMWVVHRVQLVATVPQIQTAQVVRTHPPAVDPTMPPKLQQLNSLNWNCIGAYKLWRIR